MKPFEHLNLRRNPFGEWTDDERARIARVDLSFADDLAAGDAVQLLAGQGHGKTTHLLALRDRLRVPYVRLDRTPPPTGEIVLLDETDVVWFPVRWRALRRARSVILATHRDLSLELRLLGFRPRTVRIGGQDLGAVLNHKIEALRRNPGPVPVVPNRTVRALRARFGDDVRAMEEVLYLSVQRMEAPGDVEV